MCRTRGSNGAPSRDCMQTPHMPIASYYSEKLANAPRRIMSSFFFISHFVREFVLDTEYIRLRILKMERSGSSFDLLS